MGHGRSSRDVLRGRLVKVHMIAETLIKCFYEHPHYSRRLRVILGVTNPADATEENVTVTGYEKMIHHPFFSISSISYDLMLIKLKKLIEPRNHIKTVALPQHIIPENTLCSVSTWAYNLCDSSEFRALSDGFWLCCLFSGLDSPLSFCSSAFKGFPSSFWSLCILFLLLTGRLSRLFFTIPLYLIY